MEIKQAFLAMLYKSTMNPDLSMAIRKHVQACLEQLMMIDLYDFLTLESRSDQSEYLYGMLYPTLHKEFSEHAESLSLENIIESDKFIKGYLMVVSAVLACAFAKNKPEAIILHATFVTNMNIVAVVYAQCI